MEREIIIDPSWVEIQTGLYLEQYERVINGTTYIGRKLHSSEGYCFYMANDENDPPIYYQNMGLGVSQSSWTYEQLNALYISIPIEEGMEIANTDPETETA